MSATTTPAPKALKRVAAYRTSDGAIHATRAAAELREAELAILGMAVDLEVNSGVFLDHAETIHAALGRLLKARGKAQAEG